MTPRRGRLRPQDVVEARGHGGVSAWIGVSEDTPTVYRAAGDVPPPPDAIADWDPYSEDHAANAESLRRRAVTTSNAPSSGTKGGHDFQSAGSAFTAALPWLAGKLGSPDADQRPLPGAPKS